eukprot:11490237-Karenia_brevis.AAC.1
MKEQEMDAKCCSMCKVWKQLTEFGKIQYRLNDICDECKGKEQDLDAKCCSMCKAWKPVKDFRKKDQN